MKKVFSILSWLILIAVIILLMVFSVEKQKAADCKVFEVVVVAQSENHFVNEKIINNLLKEKNLHPLGKTKTKIAIDEMEKSIANHTLIKEVNAYSDIAGNVAVEIVQKRPIARISTAINISQLNMLNAFFISYKVPL